MGIDCFDEMSMIHEDIFESRSLGNICVYIHLSNINVKEDF